MKFKLEGNKLLNAEIVSPEYPFAEFSDELCKDIPRKIVSTLNHGDDVLNILGKYHGLNDFIMTTEMVKELKDAYGRYLFDQYRIEHTDRD
jgi:hypothetical protein